LISKHNHMNHTSNYFPNHQLKLTSKHSPNKHMKLKTNKHMIK